jgi:hypothetical protein
MCVICGHIEGCCMLLLIPREPSDTFTTCNVWPMYLCMHMVIQLLCPCAGR